MSAVSLAACGVNNDSGPAKPRKGDDITVGVLLPEVARFQEFDYPAIKSQVLSLTHGKGKVLYANAGADAARQSRQVDQMIADKVDVLLVGTVADSMFIAADIKRAKDAGIPVIAYDRLPPGPIDAYISFDKAFVGQMQGQALLYALGSRAGSSKVVMMNGQAGDPNAVLYKQGALGVLKGNVNVAESYDVPAWSQDIAKKDMEQAVRAIGVGNIAGVIAANDYMAGSAIDAMKEAGAVKLPPVIGQSADLAAVQRIVSGDQYMSVYRSYQQEAADAAQMAVAKAQGGTIEFDSLTRDKVDSPTQKNIPSMLLQGVEITKDNIKDTVVHDGVYTVQQICTAKYEADCAAVGLK